jgi:hypothetical protein
LDLNKAIRALYDEKKRLDRLIGSLERVRARGGDFPRPVLRVRRGRKKMTAAQRLEVSQRMKKYWAARRQKPEEESVADAAPVATPGPDS